MTPRPADRTWEMLFQGEWTRIVAMDATTIVLASGHGVAWETEFDSSLPHPDVKARYTVPVWDPEGSLVPMPWREAGVGKLPMLAQDMGHAEVGQAMRGALGGLPGH